MNIYEVRQYVPQYSAFVVAMRTPSKEQANDKKRRILKEGKRAYVAKAVLK
jgi:hypothetical protein